MPDSQAYTASVSAGRHAPPLSQSRLKVKLSLYILTLLTSLVSLSLFAAAIPMWNANFFHAAGPVRGDWTDGLPLGPLGITILSMLAMLAYTLVKRKAPSPSRATAALYVIILVLLAPSLVLAGLGSLFRFWQGAPATSQSGEVRCNIMNIFTRVCQPVLYHVGALQIAALVFASLTWLLVFITLLVHMYEQRAMSLAGRSSAGRGLRRLTMLHVRGLHVGRRNGNDLEKGDVWVGGTHLPTRSSLSDGKGSAQGDRSRNSDRRFMGTRRNFPIARSRGDEDAMPLAPRPAEVRETWR
ncbi:hypothetical protein DV738_g5272, partial [Chaetothyriales sp. CBS 135597]